MSRILVSMWTTLDGLVAGPGDEMGWLRGDAQMMVYEQSFVGAADTLMLGRKTFGDFAGYWPAAARDTAPKAGMEEMQRNYARRVDAMKKIAVSASGDVAEWGITRVLDRIEEEEIQRLKDEAEGDIVIYGSLSVVDALSMLGLIDEYHLLVHPIVLGDGKSMFDRSRPLRLELASVEPFETGVVLMKYRKG
jgi:dihydrofolate reductase